MADSALRLISGIGSQLARQTHPNKDFLVKSLRQAANALSQLEQPASSEGSRKLEAAIKPFCKPILDSSILHHKDKDVKLLVAICVSEIFRVLAPEPPFGQKYRDIFKLILSVFGELADTTSTLFSRRVKILQIIARCRCCVIMLDCDCDDLVIELFKIFFSVVSEQHQQSLVNDMLSVMSHILNEEVSQPLLDVILQNLVNDGNVAAARLAVCVIQSCAEKLEPVVCAFLTSCILDRDAVVSELKEFYHEIIFKIFQCAPQMLLAVIPNLIRELLTDQVDVRIKAVNLIGKLFALPEHHVAKKYPDLFMEFVRRFSDKSAEVRVSAIQCAKACFMVNPSGESEILAALEGRLLDFDEKVRMQAVVVACDIARCNFELVPTKLICQATERLRDKKISVRKKALQKLLEVYRDYCNMCSEGRMATVDHLEQIPCKILILCYDKDCKEFRSQNMELVLTEDLFPALLSVEERTRHWIHIFSLFTPIHTKALNSILLQKRRLQIEMQAYLTLRKKEKDNGSEEMQRRIKATFVKMSASFSDPSKAEECLHKLNAMKDNNIFKSLAQLLSEPAVTSAQTIRDKFLKMIGDRHPQLEFLRLLSSKCMFNIFSSEHVCCILDHLSSNSMGNEHLQTSSVNLLLVIINTFPSLLRGAEAKFLKLLEDSHPVNDKMIEVLAKAGPHISVKLSDVYPFLESICMEGTRVQSKLAVSAIAALARDSEEFVFSDLCKGLVSHLHSGHNIPTVLQSLGCIAQYSVSTFEAQEGEIRSYIYEKLFQVEPSADLTSHEDASECSNSCKVKIYGLKTLVRSFLPHRGTHVRRKIDELLDILSKMLQEGDASIIILRENDKAHMRLAAAKSVLRLSRRWDLHISPDIFRFTILVSKDTSFVRRLFLEKTHKLLKERIIPFRYACAYAMAASDCIGDLQDVSYKYMAEFIKEYSREARLRQTSAENGGSLTDYPAYIVVFLVHVLAHDTGFPSEDCQDEEVYAQFCSPLFIFLQALANPSIVDGNVDVVNDAIMHLLSIFRAIRKAEDAVDVQKTRNLHILADIGISVVSALNHKGISAHAPALILLPSSLYKIGLAKISNEANVEGFTQSNFYGSFITKIIHIVTSPNSLPIATLPKCGQKYPGDSMQSDGTEHPMNPSRKRGFLSLTGATKTQKNMRLGNSTKHRQKQIVSPTDPGIINQNNTVVHNISAASENSDPHLEQEQLLASCTSVTTKPSLTKSKVATKNTGSLKESLKEISNKEALIGQQIASVSPADKSCLGTSDGSNSQNNTHKDAVFAEEPNTSLLQQSEPGSHFSLSSLEGSVDTFGDYAAQQQNTLSNNHGKMSKRIPLPVKEKKRQKASVDTSRSELTNGNENAVVRRSQRQRQQRNV